MINIHTTTPFEIQEQAVRGIPIREWDVRTVIGDNFLGVIEDSDEGYMYTDSFGHLTTFNDGEEMSEVIQWVFDSINQNLVN